MKLFHLLGFTKELTFGSSTSVTRFKFVLVCCIDGSRFFKEPAGIVYHAFEALSRGCILLELKMMFSSYDCFLAIMFFKITKFAHLSGA